MNIEPPSPATLKKYGLTADEWLDILARQSGVCPICKRVPKPNEKTGKVRFVTDHFHTRGFKKLADDQKKLWVRGITCWFCNHAYLGRGITVEKAENVAIYLRDFESRRPS